jgi:hypothetical protein
MPSRARLLTRGSYPKDGVPQADVTAHETAGRLRRGPGATRRRLVKWSYRPDCRRRVGGKLTHLTRQATRQSVHKCHTSGLYDPQLYGPDATRPS